MIKAQKLTLASNYATYKVLQERNIDSLLWEDCYDNNDLLCLHRKFKKYCNDWYYDGRGKDCSLYDGVSIGTAISNFLYSDLETWIRVFYLFEYLASNNIYTKFYVLNKKYSASKLKPIMILTKIMVRKTSHDLVLMEESCVPCELITESNMPRRVITAMIIKITSAKATNSVPNISGIHPCSLPSPFCYCNSRYCNADCSYQV